MDRHIVIFSGGLDSYILLRWGMLAHPFDAREVSAITFLYGQRNMKEVRFAQRASRALAIPHRLIDIGMLARFGKGSAMTNAAIDLPKGEAALADTKITTVPGRNTIMLAVAMAYAEGTYPNSRSTLYFGATGDDFNTPDCKEGYIANMMGAVGIGSAHQVDLKTPFIKWSKTNVLTWALNNEVKPEDLALTWSCYDNQPKPCGECRVCLHRAEAFAANGIADPLLFSENQ